MPNMTASSHARVQVEVARAAEHAAVSMRLQAKEAAAALDAAATAASRRALGLEAQLKARDREAEALQRAVEELKGAEYQALSARMGGEEAAK